jgi:hypothetical protein
MTYLDRIVADSKDRPAWMLGRESLLGASDASGFSKLASVDLYALAKLKSGSFRGNAYTESGNTWEPRMLNWFGIPQNTLLIHSENERFFGATPDGIEITPTGEIILSEGKAKHNMIVTGPTPKERRQVAWAQMVFGPDCRRTKFIWQEIVDDAPRRLEPHILIIDRDEELIAGLRTIGFLVWDKVCRARDELRSYAA